MQSDMKIQFKITYRKEAAELFLFVDNSILYIENLKEQPLLLHSYLLFLPAKYLLELINEFSKVYKINIRKISIFLCISNEEYANKIKKTI